MDLTPPTARVEPGFCPSWSACELAPCRAMRAACICSADPCQRAWMAPQNPVLQGAGPQGSEVSQSRHVIQEHSFITTGGEVTGSLRHQACAWVLRSGWRPESQSTRAAMPAHHRPGFTALTFISHSLEVEIPRSGCWRIPAGRQLPLPVSSRGRERREQALWCLC